MSFGAEKELPSGLRLLWYGRKGPDSEGGSDDGGHVGLGAEDVDRQLQFIG